jgi:hypothetical protein
MKLTAGLLFLIAGAVHAGLVGSEVNLQVPEGGPPFNETFTAVLGGPELTPYGQFEVNVEDEYLRIDWLISATIIDPAHLIFSWDVSDFSLDDATLDPTSTLAYDFTFSASTVNIDVGGIPVLTGDFVKINLVPEPASIGLLGLISGGIYFARRFFVV